MDIFEFNNEHNLVNSDIVNKLSLRFTNQSYFKLIL